MKKLILVFIAIAVDAPTVSAQSAGWDCSSAIKSISEAPGRLSCDALEIAAKIIQGTDQVPKKIYHFGKKEILFKNIEARTVPQKDWDEKIMGDKDGRSFPLTEIRRGLYGTDGIDTNFYYGRGGSDRWMMEVTLSDQCRRPENVATLVNLQKDRRFIDWAKQRLSHEERDYFSGCKFNDYLLGYWGPYTREHGPEDVKCSKITAKFLAENKIKVIQDNFIDKSFYIRDRGCIETIRGTGAELVEIFAENPFLLLQTCSERPGSKGNPALVLRELLEKEKITESISNKILDSLTTNSMLLGDDDRGVARQAINAFVSCKRRKGDADCRESVRDSIRAYLAFGENP